MSNCCHGMSTKVPHHSAGCPFALQQWRAWLKGLRALTLTQPWAQAMLGPKTFETRNWSIGYRGPVAIHAAKGWQEDDRLFAEELYGDGTLKMPPEELPRGMIIGVGVLDACHAMRGAEVKEFRLPAQWVNDLTPLERSLGNYDIEMEERYGFHVANVRELAKPVPARGMLGPWVVQSETIEAVAVQLQAGGQLP